MHVTQLDKNSSWFIHNGVRAILKGKSSAVNIRKLTYIEAVKKIWKFPALKRVKQETREQETRATKDNGVLRRITLITDLNRLDICSRFIIVLLHIKSCMW